MRTVKQEVRVLGVDDAPFSFEDDETTLVGTVFRGGSYIDNILMRPVTVDGMDVTDRVLEMRRDERIRDQLQCVLLDGITFAGFNIADLDRIAGSDVGVIAVSANAPDIGRMRDGLDNVDRTAERLELVEDAGAAKTHTVADGEMYFQHAGIGEADARRVLDVTTVLGRTPEPIRVAHLIAAALKERGPQEGA